VRAVEIGHVLARSPVGERKTQLPLTGMAIVMWASSGPVLVRRRDRPCRSGDGRCQRRLPAWRVGEVSREGSRRAPGAWIASWRSGMVLRSVASAAGCAGWRSTSERRCPGRLGALLWGLRVLLGSATTRWCLEGTCKKKPALCRRGPSCATLASSAAILFCHGTANALSYPDRPCLLAKRRAGQCRYWLAIEPQIGSDRGSQHQYRQRSGTNRQGSADWLSPP
jgi:hypothetical protein